MIKEGKKEERERGKSEGGGWFLFKEGGRL